MSDWKRTEDFRHENWYSKRGHPQYESATCEGTSRSSLQDRLGDIGRRFLRIFYKVTLSQTITPKS